LLVANPDEIPLGEAFVRGDLDVTGNILSVFTIGEYVLARPATVRKAIFRRIVATTLRIGRFFQNGGAHTRNRDRAAVTHHYDQPFQFYKLWLGKTLSYLCAYFRTVDEELDQAQQNKLDLICLKLRLQPCDQFLDIGCGWAGLLLHAASSYGVYAHGITLSKGQADVAAARIKSASLTQSCSVRLGDYRALCDNPLRFDKIASVGMFEHVGATHLTEYFTTAWNSLKPGGLFLNRGIARSHLSPVRKSSFIDRYVFPDGQLVTLAEAISAGEAVGFEVRDVENLREHYELTLRSWVEELQRNSRTILEYVSESTYRTWLLYMAGSAAAFGRGEIGIYQMLLSRLDHGKSGLPMTREDWYRQPDYHRTS
jgi:cyclopropane-fatty-acyl-phospholipid synthase